MPPAPRADGRTLGTYPTGWVSWGVDTSANTPLHKVDWGVMRHQGCSFILAKAYDQMLKESHGVDPQFHATMKTAIRQGMEPGAFLYLNTSALCGVSAVDQAKGFVQTVQSWLSYMPSGLLAVDIENGKGRPAWTGRDDPLRSLRMALWVIYQETGIRPMIYTGLHFYKTFLMRGIQWLAPYRYWMSRWDRTLSTDALETQFDHDLYLWQYGGGPWDGLTGQVLDKNVAWRPLRDDRFFPVTYVSPDDPSWETCLRDPRVTAVVLNPASGPGTVKDPKWNDLAYKAQINGKSVLGYVDLGYGKRPMGEVAYDVRMWFDLYGVGTCFWDQWEPGQMKDMRRNLYGIANPGKAIPASEFDAFPNLKFVTFEGSAQDYATTVTKAQPYPGRSIHLVYGAKGEDYRMAYNKAAQRGLLAFYVSDTDQPWNTGYVKP